MLKMSQFKLEMSKMSPQILGCIHYVLSGGEEDFINQYSIFSYSPAQFPKNFVSPREDESDFVIPPLLEFESF